MVKPWKFCHPGKQFIHIGIGRCHFRPRSRSLGDTTSMFFLVLLFLLGGNFGHILFYLVAFIQWNDLRGQTIPAFLMKGCFVDSIDIDGFNWIRITDQITQHKSSNDKKRKKINKCEGKWEGGN